MVTLTISLSVLLFAPPTTGAASPDLETPSRSAGIEFSESIPSRDHDPLQASLARTVELACEQTIPCIDECSSDEPTLALALDGADRNYTLHWIATDPRLDQPLVLESACELCSLVELEQQLATDVTQVCAQLDALDAGPGRLELSSDPTGARLRIDGQTIGRTPWSGQLPAGDHTVELWTRGHLPQRQSVAIWANVTAREHFSLIPNRVNRNRPTWPGWASLGLGFAMSVAGTALISVHGQPWAGRCNGTDIDTAGNCRFVLNTRPLGIGLVTMGAGAIGSGVGLVIWAQRDPSESCVGLRVSGRF